MGNINMWPDTVIALTPDRWIASEGMPKYLGYKMFWYPCRLEALSTRYMLLTVILKADLTYS